MAGEKKGTYLRDGGGGEGRSREVRAACALLEESNWTASNGCCIGIGVRDGARVCDEEVPGERGRLELLLELGT